MKKIVLLFSLIALLFPLFSFAKQGCCSWHGGVNYCASNGRYVCNDGTYSPSCTCGGYSTTNYYKSNTVNYLTNDQKCNNKYPGTVYRSGDGRCACPGDAVGTSSWNKYTKSCGVKYSTNYTVSNSSANAKCNAKYPGTIYRSTDNWCACPGDSVGTSSWNKYTKSCKVYVL